MKYVCGIFCAFFMSTALAAVEEDPASKSSLVMAKELDTLESRALDGDGYSAGRVAMYFLQEGDDTSGVFWLQISAENGNVEGQIELAQLLQAQVLPMSGDSVKNDQRRACYWVKKAVASGHKIDTAYDDVIRKCFVKK